MKKVTLLAFILIVINSSQSFALDRTKITPDMTNAYSHVLETLLQEYGESSEDPAVLNSLADNQISAKNIMGLAYSDLIDFDGDGRYELYTLTITGEAPMQYNHAIELTEQVWRFDDHSAELIFTRAHISDGSHNGYASEGRLLAQVGEKTFLVEEGGGVWQGNRLTATSIYQLVEDEFMEVAYARQEIVQQPQDMDKVTYTFTLDNQRLVEREMAANDPLLIEDYIDDRYRALRADYHVEDAKEVITAGTWQTLSWQKKSVVAQLAALKGTQATVGDSLEQLSYSGDTSQIDLNTEQINQLLRLIEQHYQSAQSAEIYHHQNNDGPTSDQYQLLVALLETGNGIPAIWLIDVYDYYDKTGDFNYGSYMFNDEIWYFEDNILTKHHDPSIKLAMSGIKGLYKINNDNYIIYDSFQWQDDLPYLVYGYKLYDGKISEDINCFVFYSGEPSLFSEMSIDPAIVNTPTLENYREVLNHFLEAKKDRLSQERTAIIKAFLSDHQEQLSQSYLSAVTNEKGFEIRFLDNKFKREQFASVDGQLLYIDNSLETYYSGDWQNGKVVADILMRYRDKLGGTTNPEQQLTTAQLPKINGETTLSHSQQSVTIAATDSPSQISSTAAGQLSEPAETSHLPLIALAGGIFLVSAIAYYQHRRNN